MSLGLVGQWCFENESKTIRARYFLNEDGTLVVDEMNYGDHFYLLGFHDFDPETRVMSMWFSFYSQNGEETRLNSSTSARNIYLQGADQKFELLGALPYNVPWQGKDESVLRSIFPRSSKEKKAHYLEACPPYLGL